MLPHFVASSLSLQNLAETPVPVMPQELTATQTENLQLGNLQQQLNQFQNDQNCGRWCKEVSSHLKNLYDSRKQAIEKSGWPADRQKQEQQMLSEKVAEAHRLIKETPITDKERELVASYITQHDAGEKKFGYNYEEDFDKVQVALCWKEAEHLEEILFTSLFQLRFKNPQERVEAVRANTHSLKTLSDACKEIEKTEEQDKQQQQPQVPPQQQNQTQPIQPNQQQRQQPQQQQQFQQFQQQQANTTATNTTTSFNQVQQNQNMNSRTEFQHKLQFQVKNKFENAQNQMNQFEQRRSTRRQQNVEDSDAEDEDQTDEQPQQRNFNQFQRRSMQPIQQMENGWNTQNVNKENFWSNMNQNQQQRNPYRIQNQEQFLLI